MIGLLGRILRVLAGLLILRLLLRGLAKKPSAHRSPKTPRREAGGLVRDAVCNTYLPPERALRVHLGGRECYFCSEKCRDQAIALARAS